ncbi:hypothetical protein [Candidatus Hodgkinia cicadicola]|uniref:hypothetical protein n=1 Tax=Candidatus Hodgkinia cicadicola TaxID=573658 RepID=UPI001788B935
MIDGWIPSIFILVINNNWTGNQPSHSFDGVIGSLGYLSLKYWISTLRQVLTI